MSRILIQQYLNHLQDLRTASGTNRETVVREAFKDLLKDWARSHDLIFVPEYEIETPAKDRRYVDGALLYSLRVPFGYWEAKDEKDDLDAEIEFKFRRGYPQDNIIFEDSQQAVLIQNKGRREERDVAPSDPRYMCTLSTIFAVQCHLSYLYHMPRGPRLDAPGALHHVIARGIDRRALFNDDRDRADFLNRLAALVACTGTRLYAWALIPNHFHLLLRTGAAPLSSLLRRLLTGYAVSFNRRHHRSGHLFQNRCWRRSTIQYAGHRDRGCSRTVD